MKQLYCVTVDNDGTKYIHISDASRLTGRSIQSFRHLLLEGNTVRRMKAIRDRSRILIPIAELKGFPFRTAFNYLNDDDDDVTMKGPAYNIYHYVETDDVYTYAVCPKCSAGEECDCAKEARELNVGYIEA